MSWIIFSILAALIWATSNAVDKFVLTKWSKRPTMPMTVQWSIGVIVSIFIYFWRGFSLLPESQVLILSVTVGTLEVLAGIFYFKAVKIEEISRIATLFNLAPLFVAVLAMLFLGEIFTASTYAGIFLVIVGAVIVSAKKPIRLTFSKAFLFMTLASLFFALDAVIMKYMLHTLDFWTAFSYTRLGAVFAMVPLMAMNTLHLHRAVRKYGKKVLGVIALNESLNVVGIILSTVATAIGYVTLVHALTSIQPLFVLMFAIIGSIFYPKLLKEEIGASTLAKKLAGIILMIAGVILIT
ncbi:MAG: hypothetical protein A3H70_04800 [Candidatus Komeilibacteria bacterium RIFCSPLOWO2_02_FULL_48_11]|uniref:EamA domain-containing protein n=1 Tax=Candidatus Komeilibacteria bacterium RIFCSPLOWO2_02_FULL_48_11 TaxID=1798553 RepID=A0A1G2BVB7_9BACT|nr:MAG: hypothetical protein A3H70_04800 [Candidatus Komeilibacteria bacterium RIFCSPLOWO2_02_FULL_48_11]